MLGRTCRIYYPGSGESGSEMMKSLLCQCLGPTPFRPLSGGFPANAIADTAYVDRVLVPIGDNGVAVYQVAKNGTAKLKTVLIAH